MTLTGTHLFTIVMLGYFLIVGPLLGRRELANLRRDVARGISSARLGAYRRTIVVQWILALSFMAAWLIMGRSAAEIGLSFTVLGWQWFALGLSLLATLLLAIYFHRASRDPKSLEEVRSQLGSLVLVAPHTTAELRGFTWTSITAIGFTGSTGCRVPAIRPIAAVTGDVVEDDALGASHRT